MQPNDVLRYTMTVTNSPTQLDAAVNVLLNDAIHANTTYKPGSLVITAGANAGAKTDAADADQAEVVGSGVRFRLGTGAGGTGTSGGRLAPGASTTAADLAVTKTDGKTAYVPGTTNTSTIVVSNSGPTASIGAQIADAIPAGVTGFSWTAATAGGAMGGAASGSVAIATTADLPVGGTVTFTVTAQPPAPSSGRARRNSSPANRGAGWCGCFRSLPAAS